ncbi:MAG: M3 family metallopeptidase [Bacteroidales bacterium]|nr:M3 family metallopeptidase [Bacteroidales bacterium]MDD5975413.1 M3 family metallopeptidase [Bacteroidales bacterium]MDY5194311.1 M3 family metallopeptidase [Candidatus Aphodosoma sp.]
MKKIASLLLLTLIMSTSMILAENPFFKASKQPHGTFPFNELKNEHFMPALEEAIKQHNAEIEAIINNPAKATFENTIEALERSGKLYNNVLTIFFALSSAETNDEMQKIEQKIIPIITEHGNAIILNDKLFARVKEVYSQKDKLKLNAEQQMLLKNTYESFANNGADLSAKDKETYKQLSQELSMATTKFAQNSLKETNSYSLFISDKALLSGMPEWFLETTAEKAKQAGKEGYMLDLRATCYGPLLTYADNRDLRREIWMAYNTQCLSNSQYDNTELINTIINTRLKIANLFGCKTYAEYALRDRMAENVGNVYNLLNQLIDAYTPVAQQELKEVQQYANANGGYFTIQPWDYSYYSNKLRTKKFDLNDEMLKPYFELENVKKGVFGLATKLYGIQFVKNPKIQVYHPEVEAWDVLDEKGKYIAVLYTDFHPREGKRAGAWMTEYKGQYKDEKGKDSRPHITIVMNFTRPTSTTPALLTFDEVETFLHEFGHALHGMLTKCTYSSLSGTNVYRDFVELPSQIMENWAVEKAFLDDWAVHYKTGEKIPAELVKKLVDSSNFNAGYACLRQVSFGLQDMAFHTITEPFKGDAVELEIKSTAKAQVLPNIPGTGRCTTFNHIFSGGYAAGYYSYKWAEVLDADAFAMFKKNGIFDKKTAASFRKNILERGGTEHPMTLYKRFRGSEPTIDALLIRNGIEPKKNK